MFEIPENPRYYENQRRTYALGGCYDPCALCGKAVNVGKAHWRSYVHCGGSHLVTEEEYDSLNANGQGAAQLGSYPIGPECRKLYPEVKTYTVRVGGTC